MTTKPLPSYKNRAGRNCVRFGTEGEPCWGEVQGSSRGLECVGHFGGKGYESPEAYKARLEESALRYLVMLEEEKQKKEQLLSGLEPTFLFDLEA